MPPRHLGRYTSFLFCAVLKFLSPWNELPAASPYYLDPSWVHWQVETALQNDKMSEKIGPSQIVPRLYAEEHVLMGFSIHERC